MARVFAVTNQKGGVGKTTTSVNLGASLAVNQKRTLLIDLDPQANASTGVGVVRSGETPGIYEVLINGLKLTKDLANTPANFCTPTHLADHAKALGKQFKSISVDVLDEAAMEKLGMGSLLSVSKGSAEPAKLITLKYTGGDRTIEFFREQEA